MFSFSRKLVFLKKLNRISNRQCAFLYLMHQSRKTMIFRSKYADGWNYRKCFDLDSLTNKECWYFFRFRKVDLPRLRNALRIPPTVSTPTGDVIDGLDALCVLLRRLSYPGRWCDLRRLFGRSPGSLSRIFHAVLRHVDASFGHLLLSLDHNWLREESFVEFAAAIKAKGSPLQNCFGFIDGTARPICRPKRLQRECFSGHKRLHCLKWQSVVVPNGMICHLFGAVRGSMHDARLLHESKLLESLRIKMENFEGKKFIMYGDSGYGRKEFLLTPHSKARCLADERKEEENYRNSQVRQSVEWNFKDVGQTWAFLDFKKQMKLFHVPVAALYRVGVLLANCKNCLYPNQTSIYFRIVPPSLEEYLYK